MTAERVHKFIKEFIDDEFKPEDRPAATLFLGQLSALHVTTDPHISLPLSLHFLRLTMEMTECDHCKELLNAHLKEVN